MTSVSPKDKSPYKTGFGAGIVAGGRKSGRLGCHLQLGPGGATMAAGGLWDPEPHALSRFRDAIVKDAAPFRVGSRGLQASLRGGDGRCAEDSTEGTLARSPGGGAPADEAGLCFGEGKDEVVTSPRVPVAVVKSLHAMKPFIDYLDRAALGV